MTNMARMPLFSSPSRVPRHCPLPPSVKEQVGLPWMPIFSSMPVQTTSLNSPRLPSSLTQIFGARNREMPEVPAGAPSIRARTGWMMFSTRSCSPLEMNILFPVREYVPSSFFTAMVVNAPTSEPAWGSVRSMVPDHSPLYIFFRKRFFCFSVPNLSTSFPAP